MDALAARIRGQVAVDLHVTPPAAALRVRHIRKAGFDWYLIFNEERAPLDVRVDFPGRGAPFAFDAVTGDVAPLYVVPLHFDGHELKVVGIARAG
jgi:hypothetical protein